jgi:hypothetical protein
MLVAKNSISHGLPNLGYVIFMKNVRVERVEMDCSWNVGVLGAR